MTIDLHEQKEMFKKIVELQTGESLVFASSSFLRVVDGKPKRLGAGVLKLKTRKRTGPDAGMSVLASDGQ